MFQSTFSQYVVDELYGTGKSISPQIGITYAFDNPHNIKAHFQQQQQKIDPTAQESEEKRTNDSVINKLDPQNSQALYSSQSKGNINSSPLKYESAVTAEQEKSIGKNPSLQNLLQVIQRLQVSNAQKDNQVSRLQQRLEKIEMNQKMDKQQSTINELKLQMKKSQASPEMLKLLLKLKEYRQKNMNLDENNKKLLKKLHNMETQFEELYMSEIKYLKSQLQYQMEKNKTLSIQLQDKPTEKTTQIKIRKEHMEPQYHKCDLCRQYELLNYLSKLKAQKQDMMIREKELKDNLRAITNEKNHLKAILNMHASITTMNQKADS